MVKISLKDELLHKGSTGSQSKWHIGDFWYKIDDGYYEGLAETIASDMLQKSNVNEIARIAIYDPEVIIYKGKEYQGCKSENFLNGKEELYELSELMRMYGKESVIKSWRDSVINPEESIAECIDATKEITGLSQFDEYLGMMFEFDSISLNPDRHYANICVIKSPDGFDYSPLFDHGRTFALEDDNWKNQNDVRKIAENVDARLFTGSFSKLDRIASNLCNGYHLQIHYGNADLRNSLDRCAAVYDDKILKRAELIATIQMQKYEKYFRNDLREKRIKSLAAQIDTKVRQPHTTQILQDGNIRVCLPNSAEVDKYFLINTDVEKPEISAYDSNGAPLSIYDLLGTDGEALRSYTTIYTFLSTEREDKNLSQNWEEER